MTKTANKGLGGGQEVTVSAIVLAAGRGTRMGRQKLLLPLEGKCLVQWAVDAALGAHVAVTIVVLGYEAQAVRAVLRDRRVKIVKNPDYVEGLSTSLKAGIRAARSDAGAAVFLLGDQPFVTPGMVDRLVERFLETGALIVRPFVAGRPVHPVLVGATLFPELLDERGDVGGRNVIERHADRQVAVTWDSNQLPLDIDTPEDYDKALRQIEG